MDKKWDIQFTTFLMAQLGSFKIELRVILFIIFIFWAIQEGLKWQCLTRSLFSTFETRISFLKSRVSRDENQD